ncbi:MAG: transporter substrate-binding domain-containing protein [Gammaproteobacteria bacterium]|nr:transporter substrate-binding domain-containing protein [Gammaproteobacteria bacterium]
MIQPLNRAFVVLLLFVMPCGIAAADESPLPTLNVATRSVPPFAYQDADGTWRGIAIELWERIADTIGVSSRYVEVSLDEMLKGTATGRFDAAVGALSVTPEREAAFDFSHPFYRTGLGIAVARDDDDGWWSMLGGLASPRFLGGVAALLLLLAVVGAAVWLFERRRNTQFPRDPVCGIGAGLWWSSVTMTTVGYGDKAPVTFGGRVLGLIWMFASVILISMITAGLTTALTLDALSDKVASEDDLGKVRTATVANSTSARRLRSRGISFSAFDDLGAAMQALAAGEFDAVVYDRPLLRYRVRTLYPERLRVLNITFEPQDYAIGLPPDSALREKVNRQLLAHSRGNTWEALVMRYLGTE